MTPQEILNSFTKSQLDEFEKDLKGIADRIVETGEITSEKFGETDVNLRLDNNKLLLNVTILITKETKENYKLEVVRIIKFDMVDEYLEAINKSNKSKGRKLK